MQVPMTMNRRQWLAGALLLPVAGMAAQPQMPLVEVWKDPSCGCCKDWVAILERSGFAVRVFDTGNNAMRAQLGIPVKLGSCHTAWVGGYAIEGHVPVREIQRLLRETPKRLDWQYPVW